MDSMSMDAVTGLLDYLNHSPSCYHAAANAAEALDQAGYTRLWETQPWELAMGRGYYVLRGDASLIAFRTAQEPLGAFQLAAAHCDSPTFKIREAAEVPSPGGCLRLSVEPYGGMVMRSWMDRPLSAAGRVMVREEGRIVSRLINLDQDLLVIPSVALHMDREVNKGTPLKANTDLLPLFSEGSEPGAFRRMAAQAAGVAEEDLLATDLYLYLRTPATLTGAHREFLAGARLDDLQCVYGCLRGFLAAQTVPGTVPVLALFHNEEIGSATRQGADSTFLTDALARIARFYGVSGDACRAVLANSFLVSADNAHAIHPAHPEYADSQEAPLLNGGVVIKYSAAQRYTTDALSDALFRQVCQEAGVPVQRYSNRADLPGGSTLGNISAAHLSVHSVDIGLPQLAMHASYEVAGARDIEYLIRAMTAYYIRRFRFGPEGAEEL